MAGITVKQLTDHIWLLDDNGESSGYLIAGSEKAMVIDTMNGSENIKELVERITDLELILVNTHSHPDHIGGNHYFKEAYMHAADIPFIEMFSTEEAKKSLPLIHTVKEGDKFDLGGLHLEVYEIPGHTPGSICLLSIEDRILFTGDAINHHLWMQLDGCSTLKQYGENLARIAEVKTRADQILHGHARTFDDISLMTELEKGIEALVTQEEMKVTDADPAYEWFGGVGKCHPFDEAGSVICYREENIR